MMSDARMQQGSRVKSPSLLYPGGRARNSNAARSLIYLLLICCLIALSGALLLLLYSERELLRPGRSKLLLESRLAQEAALHNDIDAAVVNGKSWAASMAKQHCM